MTGVVIGDHAYDEIMDKKGTELIEEAGRSSSTALFLDGYYRWKEFVASLSSSLALVVMKDLTDAGHFHSLLCDSR
jgi:hypothetical protein